MSDECLRDAPVILGALERALRSFEFLFFFNDTATTEIYTLSLHDALPISTGPVGFQVPLPGGGPSREERARAAKLQRSEEHTSELQSRQYLVCRLLLEKKHKLR